MVLISNDVVSSEKSMLHRTHGEETRMPEMCSSNEHGVQVELKTQDRDGTTRNSHDREQVSIKSRTSVLGCGQVDFLILERNYILWSQI